MLRINLTLASMLAIVLSLVAGLICLFPLEAKQDPADLFASSNCIDLCFMGIYPGITRVGEAMQTLQNHVWVDSLELSAPGYGYAQIQWTWSDRHPDMIDDRYAGLLTFYWVDKDAGGTVLSDALIQRIIIPTRIKLFYLEASYPLADFGVAKLEADKQLVYSLAYNRQHGTVTFATSLSCPASLVSYWNANTTVTWSIGRGSGTIVRPVDLIQLC